MDRYSPRRSLYSGPNSFVDSDEVSPEIGLHRFTGRSSSRICHISMLHVMEYNVACVLMEAWKCIAIGMMSEEETTGDGKI